MLLGCSDWAFSPGFIEETDMACCGLDKDKPLYVVFPIVAILLMAVFIGGFTALLFSPFSRRCRRATLVIWLFGASTVQEVKKRVLGRTYFINPQYKCLIAGRVMRVSPRLGGLLFKWFGTATAIFACIICLGILFILR